jgi:hypothetical protein
MSKMELINIERMEESKAVQEMLLKLNNQYFEAIQILKSKK